MLAAISRPPHAPELSGIPTLEGKRDSLCDQVPSHARGSVIPCILSCALLVSVSFCYLPLSAQTATPSTLTAPAQGSVFPGSSTTFTWNTGTGVTAYFLSLGTNGPGSANLWESGSITATTVTANGLPIDGAFINATLFSMINGTWQPVYSTFIEAQIASVPLATLTSPAPGSTLPGSTVTFTWSGDSNATAYF